jgi:hypothetical protein
MELKHYWLDWGHSSSACLASTSTAKINKKERKIKTPLLALSLEEIQICSVQ